MTATAKRYLTDKRRQFERSMSLPLDWVIASEASPNEMMLARPYLRKVAALAIRKRQQGNRYNETRA